MGGFLLTLLAAIVYFATVYKDTPDLPPPAEIEKKPTATKKVEIETATKIEDDKSEDATEKKVSFEFTSVPSGATVLFAGKSQGTTPVEIAVKPSELPIKVTMKLPGYKERTLSLRDSSPSVLQEKFEKIKPDPEPEKPKKKKKKKRPNKKKPKKKDNTIPLF